MGSPRLHASPPAVQTPLPATEGLNRIDQGRAASVADEGGVAAATVESQEEDPAVPGPLEAGSSRSRRTRKRL